MSFCFGMLACQSPILRPMGGIGKINIPVRFSVRCYIEHIHSSKLFSPPSFTKTLAEWLTFINIWRKVNHSAKLLVKEGGEKS